MKKEKQNDKPVRNTIPKEVWVTWEEICGKLRRAQGLDRIIIVEKG